MTDVTPLMSGRGLSREYAVPRNGLRVFHETKRVLHDVDIDVFPEETLAIIGESGSGKSTLVRILLALDAPTTGTVSFLDRRVLMLPPSRMRWLRSETGIVLQDPYASLDPRMTVSAIIREPLRALRIPGDHRMMVRKVLGQVGLEPWRAEQYPHELSGGQRQRVALARAIVHGPRLLIGDEPLSALDVTVRAQILELLRKLKQELRLSIIMVSHDIGLVQSIADRVAVMKDGRIVEHGPAAEVLGAPTHPYTRALLAAVPVIP